MTRPIFNFRDHMPEATPVSLADVEMPPPKAVKPTYYNSEAEALQAAKELEAQQYANVATDFNGLDFEAIGESLSR